MPDPRDEMLDRMQCSAEQPVPGREPIMPDGPTTMTEDIREFKKLVNVLGYDVKFSPNTAATEPATRTVSVTASCLVLGKLSDKYLHIWNKFAERSGIFATVRS